MGYAWQGAHKKTFVFLLFARSEIHWPQRIPQPTARRADSRTHGTAQRTYTERADTGPPAPDGAARDRRAK